MPDSKQISPELDLGVPADGWRKQPTELQKLEAEAEILEHQRIVDYDTKEYPVEVLVEKYLTGKDDDENEVYVPDYQREFVWPNVTRSKFVESVLIGLPIPYVFVADVGKGEGRLEMRGSNHGSTPAEVVCEDMTEVVGAGAR